MNIKNSKLLGYLFALFTVVVWGTTFIASKQLLLAGYTPARIMLMRFLLGYGGLWLTRPRQLKLSRKEEALFALLGVSGCSLYFLTENSALLFTSTANVSILVSCAPILTALLAHFTTDEKFNSGLLWGFLVAFTGVVMVVFNGAFVLHLNPRGDLLALSAAVFWAVYSVTIKRIKQYDPILITRRILLWGILSAIPMAVPGGAFTLAPLAASPLLLFNVIYLGLIGSALCYVLWNRAFGLLGVVSTNNCLYMIPFVTIVAAFFALHEPVSPIAILGAVLITAGVVVSQQIPKIVKNAKKNSACT